MNIKEIITEEVSSFLKETQKKKLNESSHFNTVTIGKVETVDIHSGDYKNGTLENEKVLLLKSGNRHVLLLPVKDDASMKKGTILSLDGGNDPKLNNGTWEVIAVLNDISQLYQFVKVPEIKIIFPDEDASLPNDMILDIYELVNTEMRKYIRDRMKDEFEKDFKEAFGTEYEIVKQEPSKERDKKIGEFIKKYYRQATKSLRDYYDEYLK